MVSLLCENLERFQTFDLRVLRAHFSITRKCTNLPSVRQMRKARPFDALPSQLVEKSAGESLRVHEPWPPTSFKPKAAPTDYICSPMALQSQINIHCAAQSIRIGSQHIFMFAMR